MIQVTPSSMPIARRRYTSRGKVAEWESEGERVVEFEDWEDASRVVADVYFPHELTVLSGVGRPELQLSSVDLGPVMIGKLGWGVDVAIDCEYPGAYEINIPLTGTLESRGGGGSIVSGLGQATVFSADTPNRITRWDATCSVLGIKFDRDHLEREADRILARPLRSRFVLPDQIDLGGSAGDWRRLVASLSEQGSEEVGILTNPLVSQQLAGAVTTAFVLAVVPEDGNDPPPRPGMVRRVLDALHDDPSRPWSAADMAEIAGTSVRRMQETFAHYVGSSPSAALLDIRLDRAHAELTEGKTLTVAEVAFRWGFSNPGRFAAAYKKRYGMTPSQALRDS